MSACPSICLCLLHGPHLPANVWSIQYMLVHLWFPLSCSNGWTFQVDGKCSTKWLLVISGYCTCHQRGLKTTCVMDPHCRDCRVWNRYTRCPGMNFLVSDAWIKAVETLQTSGQILPHVRKALTNRFPVKFFHKWFMFPEGSCNPYNFSHMNNVKNQLW